MEVELMEEQSILEEMLEKAIPGLAALVVLIFLLGVNPFFAWFTDRFIMYVILFFFFRPVATLLINGGADKADIIILLIGVALFIPYAILTNITVMEMITRLLEIMAIISFFFIVLDTAKQRLQSRW